MIFPPASLYCIVRKSVRVECSKATAAVTKGSAKRTFFFFFFFRQIGCSQGWASFIAFEGSAFEFRFNLFFSSCVSVLSSFGPEPLLRRDRLEPLLRVEYARGRSG